MQKWEYKVIPFLFADYTDYKEILTNLDTEYLSEGWRIVSMAPETTRVLFLIEREVVDYSSPTDDKKLTGVEV